MMGGLLGMMKYVLEGLNVNAAQMRENLDRLGGFLLSERVMFALSDKVGKQTAHDLVYEASMHGIENGVSFERSLMENKQVRDALSADELRATLDPTTYVGLAPQIVDRVLAQQRENGWLKEFTMNITILDDYQNVVRTLDAFKKLEGHNVTIWNDHTKDVDVLAERLKDTEALVLIRERTPIRAPLIERLPKLKIVSQRSVYPHIDVDALTRRGIVLSSDMHPGKPSFATAELTWGLIIAAMRRIPQEVARAQGRALAIVGGNRAARAQPRHLRLRPHRRDRRGLRPRVRHERDRVGARRLARRARADGYAVSASREAFFEQCDVVSLHLRLTPETRGIVTAGDLARMKPTALIVNTSRAGLIAPGALVEALKKGRPGMAAVDVYEEEPVLGAKHPLLRMDNVVCTPHLGYVERDGYESQFSTSFEQILAFAAGKPVNVINPEAMQKAVNVNGRRLTAAERC